jgi:hypothetical protein
MERESRYWVEAKAGTKDRRLFEQGVKTAWEWGEASQWIRWFTDGEKRYGKELWKLASIYLPGKMGTDAYPYKPTKRSGVRG